MGKSARANQARRAALYATAKIALGSAGGLGLALLLPSCGGEATSSAEPSAAAQASSGATGVGGGPSGGSTSAAGGAEGVGGNLGSGGANVGETGLACVGPIDLDQPPQLPAPTDAELSCCVAFIVASQREMAPIPASVQASAQNCCRLVVTAVELDFSRLSAVSSVHSSCCGVVTTKQAAQYQVCAPWGPPVPPAMDWEAA